MSGSAISLGIGTEGDLRGTNGGRGHRLEASNGGVGGLEVGLEADPVTLIGLRTRNLSKPGTSKSNRVGLQTKQIRIELRNLIRRKTMVEATAKGHL